LEKKGTKNKIKQNKTAQEDRYRVELRVKKCTLNLRVNYRLD